MRDSPSTLWPFTFLLLEESKKMENEDSFRDEDMDMDDSANDDISDEEAMEDANDMDDITTPPAPAEEDAAVARRRAIQAVMADTTLSADEKRFRIQSLMTGNRTIQAPAPAPVLPAQEANAACVHYERNCNIVAPCCNRVFGCRICHDELSPPGHPPLNRFMIREVVCKNCNTRQAAS